MTDIERFREYVRSLNLTQKKEWVRNLRASAKKILKDENKILAKNEPQEIRALRLANARLLKKLIEVVADELESQSVDGEEGLVVLMKYVEDVAIAFEREKYKKRYIT